jgi:hypothetical protein
MRRAEAKQLGAALAAAGVIEFPDIGGKLTKAARSVHGPASISAHWAETPQRPAPPRTMTIICVDVATALLDGGWSVDALRACSHVPQPVTVQAQATATARAAAEAEAEAAALVEAVA